MTQPSVPQDKLALLAQLLQQKKQIYRIPLSHGQQALWFIYQNAPDSPAYNMAWAVELQGQLDIAVLQRALQTIVNRHPVLRTTIGRVDDDLAQTVKPTGSYQWNEQHAFDWSEQQLMQALKIAYEKPFDLTLEGALRADLLQTAPQHYIFLLTLHHIFGDARSMDILGKELLSLYHAELTGQKLVLPPMPSSYADFVRAETSLLNSATGEGLLNYWRQQLGNDAPVLNLPTDCPRPNAQSFTGDSVPFCWSTEITQQLKQLAAQEKASLFTLLLTVFQVFLHRYTGQNEIWIGTPTSVSSRQPQFANLVGYLVNPVVLKADIDPTASFSELLSLSKQTVLEAIEHSAYPFPLLVKELQPQRDLSHSPLFQVMLDLQADFPAIEQANAQLRVSPLELAQMEGQFDLTLSLREAEQLSGRLSYSLDLFKRETIERMVKHFEVLLRAFVDNPKQAIGTVPMLTEGEIQQLQAWNDTATDYPQDQTLVDLFEAQVGATPDNIAVVFADQSLTYRQLNAKSNRLARHLLSLAKADGQPLLAHNPLVAIAVERSLEMVIGLLAILKAGGAYVPIDPGYPAARIRYMLQDSHAPLLLTQSHLTEALALEGLEHDCVVLCLDQTDVVGQLSGNLPVRSTAEDLAYVIYTSGSTGKPKGVMVENASVINLLNGFEKEAPHVKPMHGIFTVPFGFDLSVLEIFSQLCYGGSLHVLAQNIVLETELFTRYLLDEQISSAYIAPTLLELVVNELQKRKNPLQRLLVGVEPIPQKLLQEFRSLSNELYIINGYGPTEATVCATFYNFTHAFDSERRVPIGKPVVNYRIYILDLGNQPQPPCIPGELCIAGAGLARGYLNRPELTAEKFIEVELFGKTERIYKTGDLARWLPDGNLEYLGRIDHQVKLRGFRIELGEIEAALTQHEGVKEAVVSLYEADGNKRLVAYLVVSGQWLVNGNKDALVETDASLLSTIHSPLTTIHSQLTAALTAFLKSRLPDYMIPASFMVLDSLPLTPNGKLDRKALPAPELQASTGFSQPNTPTEALLAVLWANVLKREAIGRNDHFFELGGHSLLATQLVSRIRESFQTELPIRAIFEHPELARLATAIDNARKTLVLPAIEAQAEGLPKVLSFAQQRLWFLNQFEGQGNATYNMPAALRLTGPLNVEALRHSLHWLLERHESLRSCFPAQEGQAAVHLLAMEALAALHVHDLRQLDDFCAGLPPFAKACPEFAEWGVQGGFAAETFMIAEGNPNIVELSRHSGMDRRNPDCRDANNPYHPWSLGSGDPCRNDGIFLKSTVLEGTPPLTPLLQRGGLVQSLANAHAVAPFDLGQGPLFKADLLLLDDNQSVLLINMHHSVSDGWSMGVMLRDWQHAYAAFAQDRQPGLPPLAIQYSDYAAWQRQWFQGEVLESQVAYWARQLDGLPELLELPTDKPRPPQQSYRGAHFNQPLPSALSQTVAALSRQHGVTVFMALLAAFNLLLSRYSRQNDICVGSPIANRTHSHTEDLIGFFVNTLVLRSQLEPEHSFIDLLHATRQTCLEAYAHQDIPFEMLVDKLKPTRSMSHSPLFQVMFVLQNNETAEWALPGLAVGFLEIEHPVAKFDLTLSIAEQDGQFHCYWEYATDLFEAETVERMAAHFEALLEALTLNTQQAIGNVSMLTEGEIQQLQAWNDTGTDYPKDKTLVDLFEAQVEATPDTIAVVFEDQSLTYSQLNANANQLARHLLSLAKPDGQPLLTNNPLIAIAVERSLDMIIGLLAILKAGGAYVPIDPSYPASRIRYMLDDSQAPLLLTQSHLTVLLSLDGLEHDCVELCLDATDVADQPGENLPARSTAEDLAYVIYTSGSTGKPKGVMVENNGLVNLALAQIKAFEIDATSRILQFASFSFDASASEISTALLNGARLTLIAKETLLDTAQFSALLVGQQITHVTLPPSFLNNLSEQAFSDLKTLVVAGEACPVEMMKRWSQNLHFINAYGPTENTVCASAAVCFPDMDAVSIGKPIANTRIYILNAQHQLQALGIPGELCIAGAGLARGYLNRPELTAEKFIEVELFGKTERIYKTGDLARWLPDGNLEFLGRIDHQVKLRGFRIELGEIEAVLGQFEHVKEAAVSLYEADGNKRLVTYIVLSGQWLVDSKKQARLEGGASLLSTIHSQLSTFLKSRLPDYMVPAHFVVLDSLPLTPNGKIDRKALPAPDDNTRSESTLPRDNIELQLALLWETVLNVPSVGIHDVFFSLGGHSLLAVKLMNHIREQFTARLPISALFQHTTVASLAELLRQEGTRRFTELVPIHSTGTANPVYCLPGAFGSVMYLYPLATSLGAQQRFYALQTPGLDGSAIPETIEALALHHLKLMQQQQATGPYQLVGHSSGGRVAFEMAWQLEQQGETVSLLAILDTNAPGFMSFNLSELECLEAYVHLYEQIMGNSLNLPSETIRTLPDIETAYALVAQTFLQHKLLFDPKAAVDELKAMVNVVRITGQAVANHSMPGKLRCSIHLFRASEQSADNEVNDTREAWGWAQCTHATVTEHWVPGDHLSMMLNPHVKTLAEKLTRYLSDKPV